MNNLLLSTVDVLNNMVEMLKDWWVIIAVIMTAAGIGAILASSRIARVVRKTREISPNDRVKIVSRITGIALVLAGFIIILISCVTVLAGV